MPLFRFRHRSGSRSSFHRRQRAFDLLHPILEGRLVLVPHHESLIERVGCYLGLHAHLPCAERAQQQVVATMEQQPLKHDPPGR